jgi:hypothetical protein
MSVYIPECKLLKYNNLIKYIISKLQLPPEIITIIWDKVKIILINPEDSIIDFSIKLSIEHCNIKRWYWYCYNILYNSFGSSHKYFKLFILDTYFTELSSLLDSLIHNYFSLNQEYIIIDNTILLEEINKNRIDKYTNKIKICNLFYFMDTIKKYEKKMNTSNKYNKYLSNDEKKYIINFVDRTNLYLNCLEDNLNKLNNIKSTQEYNKHNYIIELSKIIPELKKKFNKFTILNNIVVK